MDTDFGAESVASHPARNLVPDELFSGLGMLALGEPRELLVMDGPGKIPLAGEPALPFAQSTLVSAPVVLLA